MAENKDFEKILNEAKELEKIDFNGDDSFDYNKYYSAIEKIANKNNTLKQDEAENVIKDFAPNFVDKKFISELENKKKSIHDFIRKYDPNGKLIAEMDVHSVDKVYSIFNYLLNSYIQYINEMDFNFEFSNYEIKFLDKILTKTIEYNGDDVFNYVEFYDSFWDATMEEFDKDKTKEKYIFKINIKKILLLHHLIKDFRVKGNTHDFKHFRNILYRIAQTNKIFNAYNIIVDRMKEDAKLWGSALEEVLMPKEEKMIEENNKLKNVEISEVTDADLGKQ